MATSPRFTSTTRTQTIAAAGNRCAYPGCTALIFDKRTSTMVGEVAHICGAQPDSARHDPEQTDEQRRAFDNAIALCLPHHREVDNAANLGTFSAEVLLAWKSVHETEQAGLREGSWLRPPNSVTTVVDGQQTTINYWVDDTDTAQLYTDKQFAQAEAAFQFYMKLQDVVALLRTIDAATPMDPNQGDGNQVKYLKDMARGVVEDPETFFAKLAELWTMLDDVTFGEFHASLIEPRPESADYSRRLEDTRKRGDTLRRQRMQESPRRFRFRNS